MQICKITIQCCTCRRRVPNNYQMFWHGSSFVHYNRYDRHQVSTPQRVLKICRKDILKVNEDKFCFRCRSIPFFEKIISRLRMQLDPCKLYAFIEMSPSKLKKGIANPFRINELCNQILTCYIRNL